MIKYEPAADIQAKIKSMAERLGINHDFSRITCVRSRGSKSRRALARCHALPRIMQAALNSRAHYVIEIVSENFENLGEEEKTRTLIHELMHIPKSFGGGFRHHDHVSRKNIEKMYRKLSDNK